ncbi:MAG: hypothetical protein HYT42_00760 [Candidatus Sungbacteria bacterium]|uniref:DUF4015 domain-containing protein n=1 Tax=Candidatus Sungiibacteriota bacterium TaxID=2750080 RepID=A0A933DTA0_9BACT|nr:hypothetical protein [Candidatus Sungbacteria bacterium]MBI4132464.1 hypothetical protein [Candidatus Sungbacteria bacterium]
MKWSLILAASIVAISGVLAADYFIPDRVVTNTDAGRAAAEAERLAERIRTAEERAKDVKGLYMSADVANDRGRPATKLREGIITLIDETELNGVVIDVKETRGGAIITDQLKNLISTLHGKNAWVIARIAVFKDSSQEKAHPAWYLKWKDTRQPDPPAGQANGQGRIWNDNRGGSWMDPAAPEVWAYQLAVAKAASDAGFDEIQFDYIRFPSDGNVAAAVYPIFQPGQPKWGILRAFFRYLHDHLKEYRPDLILSADLFGYVALQQADLGIGQRLSDIGENFNYVSLMVYPSHYYAGFQVTADPVRNLPALFYPYRASNIASTAANQPYDVVYRSLLIAGDVLAGRATTTDQNDRNVATSSPSSLASTSPGKIAKLRPWLQDFDLGVDTARGIHYNAEKVRAQINAAKDAGASGWLLWSPTNTYTKEALRPEPPRQ